MFRERVQVFGVWGLGFGVESFGVQVFMCKGVQVFMCLGVCGVGFRVQGSGFGV